LTRFVSKKEERKEEEEERGGEEEDDDHEKKKLLAFSCLSCFPCSGVHTLCAPVSCLHRA